MNKVMVLVLGALVASPSTVCGGTATKEYVDRRDAATLQEAKDYADAHGGYSSGDLTVTGKLDVNPDTAAELNVGGTIKLSVLGQDDFGTIEVKNGATGSARVVIGDQYGGSLNVHGVDVMNAIDGKASASDLSSLSGTVKAWSTYWDGDDVRLTVTNYYGAAGTPSLYLEQKMPADETHESAWFKSVWDERTRWTDFLPNFNYVSNSLADKADRAWGFYDSHTGNYAPEGYTWISSPKIAISGNMHYQRFATSEGSVWVLESNGVVTETGGDATNTPGFFRISDDEQNELFAIRKGNKRTVGATAAGITVTTSGGISTAHVPYTVNTQPTIYVTDTLDNPDWKEAGTTGACATATVTATADGYTADVTGVRSMSSMFIKATITVGGETLIENKAPVKMDYIYLGNQKYSLGTAEISGNTVLTLTPAY